MYKLDHNKKLFPEIYLIQTKNFKIKIIIIISKFIVLTH